MVGVVAVEEIGLGPFKEDVVVCGDVVEVLSQCADACVDAIVTDPPYGLEFMGKEWDKFRARNHHLEPTGASLGKRTPGGDFGERIGLGYGYPRKNPRCKKCGHLRWGREISICHCKQPDFDYRLADYPREYQSWTTAWATEAYRILKPGAYMLVMGGTRTHHRLGCGLEDAGFSLLDEIMWVHAQGFPKNHDVSKAIDKRAGAEREIVGIRSPFPPDHPRPNKDLKRWIKRLNESVGRTTVRNFDLRRDDETYLRVTAPATPEAQYWEGYGTALKPAHEPIWLCKKPNEGTYVDNVLKHGCGCLNIDGCRVEYQQGDDALEKGLQRAESPRADIRSGSFHGGIDWSKRKHIVPSGMTPSGRWPANVIVDCYPEEFIGGVIIPEKEIKLHGPPKEGLRGPEISWEKTGERDGERELWIFEETYFDDEDISEEGCTVYPYPQFVWARRGQGGVVIEGEGKGQAGRVTVDNSRDGITWGKFDHASAMEPRKDDLGNGLLGPYSRFFVIPKPSKAEKNKGCEDFYYERVKGGHIRCTRERWEELVAEEKRIKEETGKHKTLQARGNVHVTVKPVRLMKWLIKLITPHQHPVVVLDPFVGSGTTGVAALELNGEEGYQIEFYGIDKDKDSVETARARLGAAKSGQPRLL